jgi:hypothetical protein
MNVLFLNHKIQNCGVYQYGIRLYEILNKSEKVNYIYREIENEDEYRSISENPQYIIYNYHCATMSWLNNSNIQKTVKNIGIIHESNHDFFDIICNIDPNKPDDKVNTFSIPRPIYENVEKLLENAYIRPEINEFINKYSDTNIPIFGSFGFGFKNKGFDKIIKLVNDQYDEAIIKFVIPIAHFDPNLNTVNEMRDICINIPIKKGIILMISHEFFTTEEILKFLKSNTMNIFLYDYMFGRGISSVIDYAISVKRPIGISDSYMFRNIYHDDICLFKTSINDCLNNSKYIDFYNQYENKNVNDIFNQILHDY